MEQIIIIGYNVHQINQNTLYRLKVSFRITNTKIVVSKFNNGKGIIYSQLMMGTLNSI